MLAEEIQREEVPPSKAKAEDMDACNQAKETAFGAL